MGSLTPAPGAPLLGVVCGLRSEARALGRWAKDPRIAIAAAGARPEKARADAERLVAAGVRALASVGLAGGLDPSLRPGDALNPSEIVDASGARPISAEGPASGLRIDRLIHAEAIIADAAAKAALWRDVGAAAVDMESRPTAEVAAAHGLPVYTLRVVADPAERSLPRAALNAATPDGGVALGSVLVGVARRPGEIAGLIALGRDAGRASQTLSRIADEALPQWLARLADL